MRKVTTIILLMLALFAFTAVLMAEDAAKEEVSHEYVGSAKCKTCHKAEFTAWEATPHAKAFSVLSAEEAKKPECIGCHITGTLADGTVIEEVGCEACHGAGGDYKAMSIMSKKKWAAEPEKYKQMAIDAGLIYPTEETCVRCHKEEGNPNFKEFKFEEMKGKVHPVSE